MNQDNVKTKLQSIYKETVDYKVIFSGKKNRLVNGLYKPQTQEIIIHNRNFVDNEGNQNEPLLMNTAIHELAHHILMTEKGNKSPRAHTQAFWALFHDLLDIAEKKGVYKLEIDADTQELLDEARSISQQIAKLQRDLGQLLIRLDEKCRETGIRFEDAVERRAQISRKTMVQTIKACNLNLPEEIGADVQEAAIKEKNEEKREQILSAAVEGKSIDQLKPCAASPVEPEDETVALIKEKRRLERTIVSLTQRLELVTEHLKTKGEE